jgi:hypothetical protein
VRRPPARPVRSAVHTAACAAAHAIMPCRLHGCTRSIVHVAR